MWDAIEHLMKDFKETLKKRGKNVKDMMKKLIAENEMCINTKGSFRCICQIGFIPIANVCTPVQLQPISWSGPAVSAGSYCLPIVYFIAFMLYILTTALDFYA